MSLETISSSNPLHKEDIRWDLNNKINKNINGITNNIKRLTHVKLNDCKIKTIDNLNLCQNLQVLWLFDNQINKIEGLNSCINLQVLYLGNNNI